MCSRRRSHQSIITSMVESTGQAARSGEGAGSNGETWSGSLGNQQGRGHTAFAGWHPGVRLILVLVVVFPLLATGVFTESGVLSSWSFRQHAQVVADDAARLATVASARAEMNPLSVPLLAVSYASQLGISEPVLDTLL